VLPDSCAASGPKKKKAQAPGFVLNLLAPIMCEARRERAGALATRFGANGARRAQLAPKVEVGTWRLRAFTGTAPRSGKMSFDPIRRTNGGPRGRAPRLVTHAFLQLLRGRKSQVLKKNLVTVSVQRSTGPNENCPQSNGVWLAGPLVAKVCPEIKKEAKACVPPGTGQG